MVLHLELRAARHCHLHAWAAPRAAVVRNSALRTKTTKCARRSLQQSAMVLHLELRAARHCHLHAWAAPRAAVVRNSALRTQTTKYARRSRVQLLVVRNQRMAVSTCQVTRLMKMGARSF